MCRPTSDEQVGGIGKEPGHHPPLEDMMYTTTQAAKAEMAYRTERISRDFRRATARRKRRDEAAAEATGPRHARRSLRLTHPA